MHRDPGVDDSIEMKEQSARRVLEGYRERRRRRRNADTYFGSSEIVGAALEEGVSLEELDSRRSSIMEEAEADGVPLQLVELMYDIAREEGLDPAVGYELVRTGLGVVPPPEGIATTPEQPESDKYLPTWIFPPTPPDQLLRERMLRVSFRRLRSMLEQEEDVDKAFRNFANEPDVGHYGY